MYQYKARLQRAVQRQDKEIVRRLEAADRRGDGEGPRDDGPLPPEQSVQVPDADPDDPWGLFPRSVGPRDLEDRRGEPAPGQEEPGGAMQVEETGAADLMESMLMWSRPHPRPAQGHKSMSCC